MICFQISIFEPLETTQQNLSHVTLKLWFAFKLVSLNHWKQPTISFKCLGLVVICFQISIFEPLETTYATIFRPRSTLWFAFKLVSLNHWKQRLIINILYSCVVICFQISIFEPLETTRWWAFSCQEWLWFAFKLVSLNHWKQRSGRMLLPAVSCDLLSN